MITKLNAYCITCNDFEEIDEFLKQNEHSIFYYCTKYVKFLSEYLKCEFTYLICKKDSKICGILPYIQMSTFLGDIVNTLPYYGSNGGIIASSADAEAELITIYNEIAASSSVAASTYIPNLFYSDRTPKGIIYDYTDERIGQITLLSDNKNSEDELFNRIDSSTRRNIRRAKNAGIKVEVNNESFDFLIMVHEQNMEAIGGREKSPDFFKKIPLSFDKDSDYRIYTATLDGVIISALLVFYFNKTVEYFTPVTVSEYRTLQPMSLILYTAMLDAVNLGYKYWNWGATWITQQGVYKFKGKWDARDYLYKYYIKVNRAELINMKSDDILEKFPNFYVIPFNQLKD